MASALVGVVGAIFLPSNIAPLALALPVLALVGLLFLIRPEFAVLLVVGYIPFESPKYNPFGLPEALSGPKLTGFILLGVFFFNILFRRRPFRFMDDLQDFFIMLFASAMLFSGVVAFSSGAVFDSIDRIFRMFLLYFAIKNLVTSPRLMQLLLWTMLLTGTYASGFGLNIFFEQQKIFIHDQRATGIYMDANDYAGFAVIFVTVGAYLAMSTKNLLLRALAVFFIGVNAMGLLYSASRGGLIAMALVAGIFILRHPARWRLLTIVVLIVVVTFPTWPEGVRARVFGGEGEKSIYTQSADASTERRASYLDFGKDLFVQSPFFGHGFDSFAQLYPRSEYARFNNPMSDAERYRVAHNAYLEITVGTGIVGLVIFISLIAAGWRSLFRAARTLSWGTIPWATASTFELILVAASITNFFASNQHNKYLWTALGISSAMDYYTRYLANEKEKAAAIGEGERETA
jgi:O-antigen ligase